MSRILLSILLLSVLTPRPATAASTGVRATIAGAVVGGGLFLYLDESNSKEVNGRFFDWEEKKWSQKKVIGWSVGAGVATYALVFAFSGPANNRALLEIAPRLKFRPVLPMLYPGGLHLPLMRWRF